MDQHGFDDQRSTYVTATEAARLLHVKVATLYAYVSRGLVRSVSGADRTRARKYSRADVERLRERHDARAGHAAVAAGALRFGEPVLDSAITSIDPTRGPIYRGSVAVELAARGTPFESVAALLWNAPEARDEWPAAISLSSAKIRALLPRSARPIDALVLATEVARLADASRASASDAAELVRARRLIRMLTGAAALPLRPALAEAALRAPSVAAGVCLALGGHGAAAVRAIDKALVVLADHELNVSAFAARVAASAGADLYACVVAALATFCGPMHGGMCDRVEALLAELPPGRAAGRVLGERLRRGDAVAGFGHRLYPSGDPRTLVLLDACKEWRGRARAMRPVHGLVAAMEALGQEPPSVDLGMVALARVLGLDPGSATVIFAIGRTAGWVAHVLEQRRAGFLVRPRARAVARYIGATSTLPLESTSRNAPSVIAKIPAPSA